MDSKTLSTAFTSPQQHYQSFHSYHRIDSILTYFTTFISDLRLNIVDLKHVIYELIGVEIKPTINRYSERCECDSCEVQFMMRECRHLREDIVKICATMKGFSKSKDFNKMINCSEDGDQSRTCYFAEKTHDNMFLQLSQQLSLYQNTDKINERESYEVMGPLTFRQLSHNSTSKYFSEKKIEDKCIKQIWKQNKENNDLRRNDLSGQNFDLALKLVQLIRSQVEGDTKLQEKSQQS